jgi:hypothetical protein
MNPNPKELGLESAPVETKKETVNEQKMRQIIIETDGNNVNIVKAEVSGKIEFVAIMNLIATSVKQSK